MRVWRGSLKLFWSGLGGLLLFGVGSVAMFMDRWRSPATSERVVAWIVLVLAVPMTLASLWAVASGVLNRSVLRIGRGRVTLRTFGAPGVSVALTDLARVRVVALGPGLPLVGLTLKEGAPRTEAMRLGREATGDDVLLDVTNTDADPAAVAATIADAAGLPFGV